MKIEITQEQLDELSPDAREGYLQWKLSTTDESGSLRSIPVLILFLDEHIRAGWWHIEREGNKKYWRVDSKYFDFSGSEQEEVCDALWEAIKIYLEAEYGGEEG